MLPNIDTAAATAVTGAGATPQVKRTDADKILEAYPAPSAERTKASEGAGEASRSVEKSERIVSRSETDRFRKGFGTDQAEIKLQLTREEREVFLNAMSGRESPTEMSEEEQTLLQKTSERIEKMLDEADTRNTETRERVDKAVKEWYVRLANGKQPPADLLTLLRQAAAGELK